MFKFTIDGVRGSEPVSGAAYGKYGGRTSCYHLTSPGGVIILDAGSGIVPLGRVLEKLKEVPPIDIFFTHFHLDHILGLPLFKPIYRNGAHITLWAEGGQSNTWQKAIQAIAGKPIWPVELTEAGSTVRFENLPNSGNTIERHGVKISWCPVWHPQACMSYKLEIGGQTVVLTTDREPDDGTLDKNFLRFCYQADFLIHDAQYLPEEYDEHRGWGHSTWENAAHTAADVGAGELILTHHDPLRTDKEIDEIVEKAKNIFPKTRAAHEGMVLIDV